MTKTRTSKRWFAISFALIAVLAPAAALAKSEVRTNANVQPVQPLSLADNVVVTPGAPAQQPNPPTVVVPQNPPPQPAPVVVTPAPAAPAPAEAPRRTNTIVEREQRSYVGTVFVSALLGGLAGALIGGSIWYLADDQTRTARIGYWAAGGVLVGSAVGVTQILVQESRVERATAFATDPAPTFRLSLARIRF